MAVLKNFFEGLNCYNSPWYLIRCGIENSFEVKKARKNYFRNLKTSSNKLMTCLWKQTQPKISHFTSCNSENFHRKPKSYFCIFYVLSYGFSHYFLFIFVGKLLQKVKHTFSKTDNDEKVFGLCGNLYGNFFVLYLAEPTKKARKYLKTNILLGKVTRNQYFRLFI